MPIISTILVYYSFKKIAKEIIENNKMYLNKVGLIFLQL